jgi:hypothetical protein
MITQTWIINEHVDEHAKEAMRHKPVRTQTIVSKCSVAVLEASS